MSQIGGGTGWVPPPGFRLVQFDMHMPTAQKKGAQQSLSTEQVDVLHGLAHTLATPPAPHTAGEMHVPQLRTPPQPSPI